MKTKKWISFFCAALMFVSLLAMPAMATEPEQQEIDLGDGFYMIRTVTAQPMTRADDDDRVYGTVSGSVFYGDDEIGTATLTAIFDISGSSAVALSASLMGSGMKGFTYRSGGTACTVNRATGTAIFESSTVFKQLPLSISCTPDGDLY